MAARFSRRSRMCFELLRKIQVVMPKRTVNMSPSFRDCSSAQWPCCDVGVWSRLPKIGTAPGRAGGSLYLRCHRYDSRRAYARDKASMAAKTIIKAEASLLSSIVLTRRRANLKIEQREQRNGLQQKLQRILNRCGGWRVRMYKEGFRRNNRSLRSDLSMRYTFPLLSGGSCYRQVFPLLKSYMWRRSTILSRTGARPTGGFPECPTLLDSTCQMDDGSATRNI